MSKSFKELVEILGNDDSYDERSDDGKYIPQFILDVRVTSPVLKVWDNWDLDSIDNTDNIFGYHLRYFIS